MRIDRLYVCKLFKILGFKWIINNSFSIWFYFFFSVLSLLALLEYGIIPGNQQGFYCQDPQISFKFEGEVVSPLVLGLGCIAIPFVALLLTEILSKRTYKNIDVGILWYCYKECATGCILVLLLTEIAKIVFGEHRPHFLDVCQPDNALTCKPFEYVKSFTCTNPKYSKYFLIDSSRSFPSGHASLSWFIGTFSAVSISNIFK